MGSFLSTLLGAFLGVSLPFVISAILERINFKKMLNTIFVQYETYNQNFSVRAAYVVKEADQSWQDYQKNCRNTLAMNFGSVVDCSDLLLNQYSKFLRSSDAFHLIQDKQNTATVLNTLINSNYEKANDLNSVLTSFGEFLVRRTWTLFTIAKKEDLSFSREKYNSLIMRIGKMKNKKLTKVKNSAEFRKKTE